MHSHQSYMISDLLDKEFQITARKLEQQNALIAELGQLVFSAKQCSDNDQQRLAESRLEVLLTIFTARYPGERMSSRAVVATVDMEKFYAIQERNDKALQKLMAIQHARNEATKESKVAPATTHPDTFFTTKANPSKKDKTSDTEKSHSRSSSSRFGGAPEYLY